MNFKNISLILSLLCYNLKAIAGPLGKENVDISFGNESDDEELTLNIDNFEDIFSDDENMITDVINNIEDEEEECSSEECIQTSKRILSSMDLSVNPCDDFYHYVCGGWESKALANEKDIPPISFNGLQEKTNKDIRKIIEGEYIVDEKLSEEEQIYDEKTFKKLKSLYNICMTKETHESYPNEHLKNFINNLNIAENRENLKNPEVLTNLILKLQMNGIDSFVKTTVMLKDYVYGKPVLTLFISIDLFTRLINYLMIDRLPDAIPLFKEHIKNVLVSIRENETDIDSAVDSIFNTETKMSKLIASSLSVILQMTSNNPPKKYEVLKFNELNEKYSYINWSMYYKKLFEFYGINYVIREDMIVFNPFPDLYEGINQLVNEMTVDDLVNYLEWNIINYPSLNDYISGDIPEEQIEFNNKLEELQDNLSSEDLNDLLGIDISSLIDIDDEEKENNDIIKTLVNKYSRVFLHKRDDDNHDQAEKVEEEKEKEEEEDRYDICYAHLSTLMPMAIAKYFVEKNFNGNVKDEVKQMIENIKEAMINRIPKMEWLDEETKDYAREKVLKMKDRIGYPDDIMDPKKLYQKYESLEIHNLFDLIIHSNVISNGMPLKNIDTNEWLITPYTVNAYYDLNSNSINFPAAILQSPFYDINGQDYINYGSSGAVIGHELTHAFDNNGRKYDANGELNNWWTDNDNEEFTDYAQCFIDEYNSLTYQIDSKVFNVKGESTLGENLADNGGLARAYDAWQLSLLKNPERAAERNKKLPGFENNTTIEQLFYIAYGQNFCSLNTILQQLDSHSPGIARINGVVANSKHFAKTFKCPTNSAMNPDNKCIIW